MLSIIFLVSVFFRLSDERTYVEKRNGMNKMGFGGMVDSMALLTAISAIDLNGFFEVTSDIPQLIAQLNCFVFGYLLLCKYANLSNRAGQHAPSSWS